MWLRFLQLAFVAVYVCAYQQLYDPINPMKFSTFLRPLSFSNVYPQLSTALYANSYALTCWVFFHTLPLAPQEFIYIKTLPGSSSLQAMVNPDGSLSINGSVCESSFSLQVTGFRIDEWQHIDLSLDSQSQQLLVSAISWNGVQVVQTKNLSFLFSVPKPALDNIRLGGIDPVSNPFEMVDARYYAQGLTAADMRVAAEVGTCWIENMGMVARPAMESCHYYYFGIGSGRTNVIDCIIWSPKLVFKKLYSSISVTQWIWFTSAASTNTLVRISQNLIPAGTLGDKVMAVVFTRTSTSRTLSLRFDTTTAADQSLPDLPLPVSASQLAHTGQWVFVSASIANGFGILCYGLYSSVSLTCASGTPGGMNFAWGTADAPRFYYGNSLNTKYVDIRYYGIDLSQSEMSTLFTQRKLACLLNCQTCSDLLTCTQCKFGWYSNSILCFRCNACCVGCTASGNTSCLSCAPSCLSTGPSTCISKCYIECAPGCATCSGLYLDSCLTCQQGLYLQPYGACLSTCPSGYSPSAGNTCVSSGSSSIFDVTLDKNRPTILAATGQTLLNGATLAYYPSFEPSDPRPVLHRGAYFSGSAYIQLPPAPFTSGAPLMLSDTLSFATWIRPQGAGSQQVIFSKYLPSDSFTALQLALDSLNQIKISANGYVKNAKVAIDITVPSSVLLDQWTYVTFTLNYQAGQTFTNVYYNGVMKHTDTSVFRLTDIHDIAFQSIGYLPTVGSYYQGFIWRIVIHPYIRSFAADIRNSGCPAELSYCLSPAPLSETYTGQKCAADCSDGCVRSSDCGLCADPLCDVCSDFETLTCSQCIPRAAVIATCTCSQGYWFNALTRSCDLCASVCRLCTQTSTKCTECFDNAELDFEGNCKCYPSFYWNPAVHACELCNSTCLTCTSASICTSCKPRAQLDGNQCVCSSGYYGSPDDCVLCSQGCQTCNKDACLRCELGLFNVDGACSLHCPPNCAEDANNWVCLPLPNPYKGVSVSGKVDDFNNVILNFSQPVQPELSMEALSLILTDTDSKPYSFTANMSELALSQTYNLTLAMQDAYLPADNELNILFLRPELYTDIYGNRILNFSLSVTLHQIGESTAPATKKDSEAKRNAVVAAASSVVSGLTVGFITGNPLSLFTVFNNIQLLAYLPLSTIPLPDSLKQGLAGMNMLSLVTNYLPDFTKKTEVGQPPPQFAQDYGFSDASFAVNAGVIIATAGFNVGIFLVLCVLSKISSADAYIKKALEGYHWRNVGMHWIMSYLDSSVAAYLQVIRVIPKQMSFASAKAGLISLLGCSVAACNFALPFALLYLYIKDRSTIHSKCLDSIRPRAFLYAGLRSSGLCPAYYGLFLLRRLGLVLTLLFLNEFPFTQALICYSLAFLVKPIQTVFYLAMYRPFENKLQTITVIVTEVAIGVVFLLVIGFNFNLPSNISQLMSRLVLVCAYIATSFPIVTDLVRLVLRLSNLAGKSKMASVVVPLSGHAQAHFTSADREKCQLAAPPKALSASH